MMRIARLLLVFSLLLIIGPAVSQEVSDSLKNILKSATGTLRIDVLNELSWESRFQDPKIMESYATEAMHDAVNLNYTRGIIYANRNLAVVCYLTGNSKQGLVYAHKGIDMARETDDAFILGKLLNAAGMLEQSLSRYGSATDYYLQAMEIFKKLDNSEEVAGELNNLGNVYQVVGETEKALSNFIEVLKIEEKAGNKIGMARTLNNLGSIYLEIGRNELAVSTFEKSIRLCDEACNPRFKSAALNGLASAYSNLNKPDKAIKYYLQAIEINKKNEYWLWYANTLLNLAGVYHSLGRTEDAFNLVREAKTIYSSLGETDGLASSLLSESQWLVGMGKYNEALPIADSVITLARDADLLPLLKDGYKTLYLIWKERGMYKTAMENLEASFTVSDSLTQMENIHELADMTAKYEIEQKDRENKILEMQNTLGNKMIARQRWLLIMLGFITGIMIILMLLLNKSRKITKRNNELLALKNEEIHKQALALEEANGSKDMFLSIIGHDLKNPMTGIMGYSDLLATGISEYSGDEIQHFAREINTGTKNLNRLLDNLLLWAQANLKKVSPRIENINLHEIAERSLQTLLSNAESKSIRLYNQVPVDMSIKADPEMIRTIIMNLVSNAIKFTPMNGTVNVTATTADKMHEISVKDSGVGMTRQELARLFHAHGPTSTPGTNNEQGTGLGLLLCKEFTEMHGGTIQAFSHEGTGSTFTFTIPTG
jgi:signal transduction histidine kinase